MNAVLAPMLGIRHAYRPRKGERFDVGDGRVMTVREIVLASGTNPSAIYSRLKRGETGEKLLRPLRRKLYDVGDRRMTLGQIMQSTGLSESAARSRISRGVTGAALLRKGRHDMAAPRSSTMVIACRLADAYPDRLPTTREIRAIYPMTPTSAERWLAALRAARPA